MVLEYAVVCRFDNVSPVVASQPRLTTSDRAKANLYDLRQSSQKSRIEQEYRGKRALLNQWSATLMLTHDSSIEPARGEAMIKFRTDYESR
jgi:hypothetical protein